VTAKLSQRPAILHLSPWHRTPVRSSVGQYRTPVLVL